MPPSATATPGSVAHAREQRLGQRRRRDAVVRVAADRALAGDDGVGVLVDLREDGAERGLDRVRQDVRAADHRDAEHDRRPPSATARSLRPSRPLSATPITSRACSSPRAPRRRSRPCSSCTISPSARKRMRSAIAAARASCVTITVVWPYVVDRVRAAGRGSRRPSSSRGCRSARRRRGSSAARRARARSRRAAAGRRRAPTGGACGGRRARCSSSSSSSHCWLGLLAGDRERQDDVLLRGQHRQQVEELEDEADVLAAQPRQLRVGERRDLLPAIVTVPLVGLSRPARMCISVDLPEPDGPMTATSWPDSTSSETPRSASTAVAPSP